MLQSCIIITKKQLTNKSFRRFASKNNIAIKKHDFARYAKLQAALTNRQRAPQGDETFEQLRNNPHLAFRDIAPFFDVMRVLEAENEGAVDSLLRGRRWGKTVLGDAWLAFLSGESHLFKGTAVETKMRKDKLIGVRLDFSRAKVLGDLMIEFERSVSYGLKRAANADPTFSYSPLEILYPKDVSTNHWTISDCRYIFDHIFAFMNRIAHSSSKKFALFIDEYDSFVIEALQDQSNSDNYLTTNDFFGHFFTGLKAHVDSIPFQFITGSSRLAIRGFWSGANNIVDLSSNPRAATALGYTWE